LPDEKKEIMVDGPEGPGTVPVVEMSEEEYKEWRSKGWLSEDGICCFPEHVMGYDPGWIGRVYGPTYDDAKEAFTNGWAKFVDADAAKLTLSEWQARYPGTSRPDPIKQLFLMHKLPPRNEFVHVFVIGKTGRINPSKKVFKQLSKRPEFQ